MDEHFIVAAGGAGIRVAEAFVHVCAAGLGPEKIHLLVLDVDDTNGNLSRLRSTLHEYAQCRKSWRPGGASASGHKPFFSTDFKVYYLTDGLATAANGIKGTQVTPPTLLPVLDLFFTQDEQSTTCKEGFLARPNLGSLIMVDHLQNSFSRSGSDASKFKLALETAMAADVDENLPSPALVAVGSVFGGTGASVLPILCETLKSSLSGGGVGHGAIMAQFKRIRKAAVMMLPYFQPKPPPQGANPEETVDPTRFLADTRNALSYYSRSGAHREYDQIYLIGADHFQSVEFKTGSKGQANAPLIEELTGALGIIDATLTMPDHEEHKVKVSRPAPNSVSLDLNHLCWPGGAAGSARFKALLHAAVFALKKGANPLEMGAFQFLKEEGEEEARLWPWFHELGLDPAGGAATDLAVDGKTLTPYFYRLLLWSKECFEGRGLKMLEFDPKGTCYHYWEALSTVTAKDGTPKPTDGVTPFVVVVTACVKGLEKLSDYPRSPGAKELLKGCQEDWLKREREELGTCLLPMKAADLEESRAMIGLGTSEEYTRTKVS